MNREFYGMSIPEHMHAPLRRYFEEYIPTGSFLEAVLCNDLREAVAQADNDNIRNIPAFVNWLYNEAPAGSWGSREAYENWISRRGPGQSSGLTYGLTAPSSEHGATLKDERDR